MVYFLQRMAGMWPARFVPAGTNLEVEIYLQEVYWGHAEEQASQETEQQEVQ